MFITGSSDGFDLVAAKLLLEQGRTVAHARDALRADHTRRELPSAGEMLYGYVR